MCSGSSPPPARPSCSWTAWALEVTKWRDQLEEFDRQDRPWITVMAAWNPDDPQTARNRRHLGDQLRSTLVRRYHQRRPGLQLDVDIAGSLLDVGRALPAVLQESAQRFGRWRNQQGTPVRPPPGPRPPDLSTNPDRPHRRN